jgi:hypothetical protein
MTNNNETNPNTYNGWTNYETWCINLWLTNTPDDYNYLSRLANHPRLSDYEKADQLRADIEESIPDTVEGLYRDLLLSAISSCNFHEIIKSMQEEDQEEDDKEDNDQEEEDD